MYNRSFILILFLLIFGQGFGQNYFSNPSFEDFYILPRNFTMVEEKNSEIIPRWFFLATPDYFHQLSKFKEVQIPKNFAGTNKTKQGRAYAGLILRADPEKYRLPTVPDSEHYSEHLQNVLDKPLVKDQLYCCRIYLSLSELSGLAVDGFGLYFSEEQIFFQEKSDVLQYKPQIENKEGNIMFVHKDWMIFSGLYRATGNEHYVTIGNFKSLEDTKYLRIQPKERDKMNLFAYYYIDDLSLIPVKDTSECECTANSYTLNGMYSEKEVQQNVEYASLYYDVNDTVTQINTEGFGLIEFGKPVTLENIYFDFDEYELLPESFEELNKLFDILKNSCERCSISIEGHTDSYGGDEYNLLLSENRAKAVANYLIQKGIAGTRIAFVGYGRSRPVASNEEEKGRQKNRRVEFIITK